MIDDRLPDPQFGAGFPRAYRFVLSLLNLGHKIHFFPNVRESIKDLNLKRLKEHGIEVYDDLNKLPTDIKLIICSRPHNTHYHLPVASKILPHAKTIYDTEALWFRRYDLQLSITGKLPGWAYRYDEIGMAQKVDLCFVVNDIEKSILEENGAKKVVKLGHAIDVHNEGFSFQDRKDFLFVGGTLEENSSNEDAIWVFLENCWNKIRQLTGANLNITGKVTSPRLLNHSFDGVNLMGHVPDLVPLYESHRAFVAYTRFATGIPWKVHESMAHGLPCIISPLLSNQLNTIDRIDAMVGKDSEDAISKSVELYSNQSLWENMQNNSIKLIQRDCNPEDFKSIIHSTVSELCG
jgi:glycosyltransferase involved in cell wall biosynthesis